MTDYSAHDLRNAMITLKQAKEADVGQYLLEALAELAAGGFITWKYEPNYGVLPGERPAVYDEASLRADWSRCFPEGGPRPCIPDLYNPTLLFAATNSLCEELGNPEYDLRYPPYSSRHRKQ